MAPKEIPVDPNNPLLRYTCAGCGGGCFGHLCDECTEEKNNAVVWEEIAIPQHLFDKLADTYSADTAAKDRIRGIFHYKGKELYNQGGAYLKGQKGWIHACILIREEEWDGPKYSYSELSRVNGTGGSFHSNFHRVEYRGQGFVVKPNHFIKFTCIPEEKQISMFGEE